MRRTTFYKSIRAIWGKSKIQYFPCAFLDRTNDTLYIPGYFVKSNSTEIATSTLCMMNMQWTGIGHLLNDFILQRMEKYMSGEREHLGPKSDSKQKKMLGDKTIFRALRDEEPDHSKRPRGDQSATEEAGKWRASGWHARDGDAWQSQASNQRSAHGDVKRQEYHKTDDKKNTSNDETIPPLRQQPHSSSSSTTRPAPYSPWDASRSSEGWWKS